MNVIEVVTRPGELWWMHVWKLNTPLTSEDALGMYEHCPVCVTCPKQAWNGEKLWGVREIKVVDLLHLPYLPSYYQWIPRCNYRWVIVCWLCVDEIIGHDVVHSGFGRGVIREQRVLHVLGNLSILQTCKPTDINRYETIFQSALNIGPACHESKLNPMISHNIYVFQVIYCNGKVGIVLMSMFSWQGAVCSTYYVLILTKAGGEVLVNLLHLIKERGGVKLPRLC